MYILGLAANGHNPAACLLKDGRLVAMAEEERFIRVKAAFRYFPIQAACFCLRHAGIGPKDVSYIAMGWDANRYRLHMPLFFASSLLRYPRKGLPSLRWEWNGLHRFMPPFHRRYIYSHLRRAGFTDPLPPLLFAGHHLAHAASSYYCSGFDHASVLTIDGSGEDMCTVLWRGCGSGLMPFVKWCIPQSLGWFYSALTQLLGFKPNEGESKVMGLAAYGEPDKQITSKLEKVIRTDPAGDYRLAPYRIYYGRHSSGVGISQGLSDLFGLPRRPGSDITQYHSNVAFALQAKLEEALTCLARRAISQTDSRNLCLAGGVALNCKANGALATQPFVDRLFVQPASNDAGTALGAALVVSAKLGIDPRHKLDHAYWGPDYTDDQIRQMIAQCGLQAIQCDAPYLAAADLAEGKIVGWLQGRMEIGPRALGNRSILARPSPRSVADVVNRIKGREPWRPLSPSMTIDAAKRYLEGNHAGPFMIVASQVAPGLHEEIPAVVHVDGTVRPQIVTPEANPRFHQLIQELGRRTGIPVVLNTSFNVRGEPIVCSPVDAIRCFCSTDLDVLYLGDYRLKKPAL